MSRFSGRNTSAWQTFAALTVGSGKRRLMVCRACRDIHPASAASPSLETILSDAATGHEQESSSVSRGSVMLLFEIATLHHCPLASLCCREGSRVLGIRMGLMADCYSPRLVIDLSGSPAGPPALGDFPLTPQLRRRLQLQDLSSVLSKSPMWLACKDTEVD